MTTSTIEELQRSSRRQDGARRVLDDDRVMSFALWCEVNGFSPATGRRLRKAGKGPVFTQISDRRIGVTVGNNRRWQQSRKLTDAAGGEANT
jgi:hypothetical protein